MKTDAKISECEKYRYSLRRIWDENKSRVAFIALNPSTADEVNNDKTIERCIDFAKSWGQVGCTCLMCLLIVLQTQLK